jgi:hypothetical protein
MNEILLKISEIIELYESGTWITEDKLRVMQRELTSNIFFMTKHNIDYFNAHNAIQYKHKGSVSSGLVLANEQVPELRMLRKIESAANNVVNSMRSEITSLRK